MNAIRILFSVCAMSALLAAQTSTSTSTTPTTRPRSQTATTPTTSSTSTGSRVTLPSGTPIEVRVNENLSSETTQQGARFTGTVTSDVTDPNSNRVIIPRGAEVTGRVLSATPSGRLSNSGELQLSLNTIHYGNAVANVTVEPFVLKGGSQTKSTATKVGGGAALGAIIGAIAGGGKGAAIGAGVGGAAGAGTAAATGKRPAEVQPEALVKFITSGDTMVTAADQSGYSNTSAANTSPNASPSTWPEPSRPATSSTTQSTATSSTTSTDTSADSTVNSDNSDAPPVMHRRDGSAAPTPSASTDNGTGTVATRNSTTTASNTTTAAGNSTYGTSNPAAASTGVYGSATTPANSTTTHSTTTTATTPAAPSTTTSTTSSSTSSLPDNRLFSARDRRVVNQCIRDNAASLPSSYMHKGTAMSGYQRGQVLSADVQRQLRSLPLACDNQLPAVSNDLERVIYGGQVMLIDSSNRVLDVFDLNP